MRDIIPPLSNFNQLPEETLKLVSYCPVCHYHYNPLEARVLDESEGAHLIFVRCGRCKSAIVALILNGSFGISSVGLVTDLDGDEIDKFRELSSITADDVIANYEFIRGGELERVVGL